MTAESVAREVLRIFFDRGTDERFDVRSEADVDRLPESELYAAADLIRAWHDGENCWDEVWTLAKEEEAMSHVAER